MLVDEQLGCDRVSSFMKSQARIVGSHHTDQPAASRGFIVDDQYRAHDADDDDVDPDIDWNMVVEMEEPYLPRQSPDDYRCFLIEWPGDVAQYMTSFEIRPGRADMAHHLLAYKVDADSVDQYRRADANEEGPGYTCYGGPSPDGTFAGSQLFGSWVPGQGVLRMPEDTGILFEPGTLMVFQMHYNTLVVDPEPDLSSYAFRFEDSVERPAAAALFFNYLWTADGMPIPAGEPDVAHEYTVPVSASIGTLGPEIGATAFDSFAIHAAGPHLHQFGRAAKVEILRAGGDPECLVDIPEWDFWWQVAYDFEEEVEVSALDSLRLKCRFDNSPENQPIIDGKQMQPRDINWGDGSLDEMCLVGLYVTKSRGSELAGR